MYCLLWIRSYYDLNAFYNLLPYNINTYGNEEKED